MPDLDCGILPSAVDFAYRCIVGDGQPFLLTLGWAKLSPGERLLLVDGPEQKPLILRTTFFPRPDVDSILGVCLNQQQGDYGFVGIAEGSSSTGKIKLLGASQQRIRLGADIEPETRHGFRGMLSAFSSLPLTGYDRRIVLEGLLQQITDIGTRECEAITGHGHRPEIVGEQPAAPRFSLLIHGQGMHERLITQLLAFSDDPEVISKAEIVYMLARSPEHGELAERVKQLCLAQGLSAKIIRHDANRNPGMAWNIGASHARGEIFVFITSAAIPINPGWLASISGHGPVVGCQILDILGRRRSSLRCLASDGASLIELPDGARRKAMSERFYAGPVLICGKGIFCSKVRFNPVYQDSELAVMDWHRRLLTLGIPLRCMDEAFFTLCAPIENACGPVDMDLTLFAASQNAIKLGKQPGGAYAQ